MQYSAKVDCMKLIEKLEKSCIRFIHFSSENEHISRAFAEMLGLDTGWNCHISLGNVSVRLILSQDFVLKNFFFRNVLIFKDTSITAKKLTNEQMSTLSRTGLGHNETIRSSANDAAICENYLPEKTFFSKLSIFKIIRSRENFRLRNSNTKSRRLGERKVSFIYLHEIGK